MGLAAPRHVGSSRIMDPTGVPQRVSLHHKASSSPLDQQGSPGGHSLDIVGLGLVSAFGACVTAVRVLVELVSSWEEDRKFVLRAWCLVFIVLATMMLLSVLDGRMAYLYGSYTGYVGFWTNCRKHMCADLHQVTVLIHMSMGFMILAMILSLVLLLAMGFSFRPALRRLNKTDLVFSTLSSFTGLLILLSLTLFIANCEMLRPRPHISYLVTTYLSWGAGALMLWAGILSYLNYMGMWGKGTPSVERRMSYRRWASLQSTRKSISEPPSDAGSKHTEDLSV